MSDRTQQTLHCDAFLSINADRDIHKAPHRFDSPPVGASGAPVPDAVTARRLTSSLETLQSSFNVWAALADLEVLMSDHRRLAPAFTFEQLCGQASVAAGNEYRYRIREPDTLHRLEQACTELAGADRNGRLGGERLMDLRVERAGPWGGETGEMVVSALENHGLAGMASLWVLVHGDGADAPLRVTLDVLEVTRWAWAPDSMVARDRGDAPGILDWPHMFERLAGFLDARPVPGARDETFSLTAPISDVAGDERVREALRIHPALAGLLPGAV